MWLLANKLVQLWTSIFLLTLNNQIYYGDCVGVPQIRIYELNLGNLTMLQDPPNTDVSLPSNHDNPDRYLILQCRAPYPVQWIYSGDGIPEFITNTTVSWETEPKEFIASAGLFRLFEHHTGTYTCRSINTPHLSSYYHLYFTGENLLASNVGDKITFSRHDPTVRIPCSVSDPKAHVTLQKLVDGYVNCPVNDSISYNKKSGFTLKVTNDYQPVGEYICIAHTKGRFSVLEFKVLMEELDTSKQESQNQNRPPPQLMPALKPARPTLTTSPDYASTPAMPYPGRPTNPSLRPSHPHFSPRPEVPSSSNPKCTEYTCGRNAQCQLNASDRPVCKCEPHFKGDPYIRCYPECIVDTDCPRNRICFDNACENPCPSACGAPPGQLLSCSVVNHTAICTYHHCNPTPCGPFSECHHLQKGAVCSCLKGYYGRPPHCSASNSVHGHGQDQGFGQTLISTTTLRVSELNSSETLTTLKPTRKPKPQLKPQPYPDPSIPQSPSHSSPPSSSSRPSRPNPPSSSNRPSHPSRPSSPNRPHNLELEKDNIETEVRVVEGSQFAVDTENIFDLEPEVDFDPDSCRVHTDCNITHKCVDKRCRNPCEPNPCGRSAICHVKMHEPICTCSPGFIRVNQYCLITNCKSNRDCPETKSCVRNKCINPCAGYCGKHSECVVHDHAPSCQCQPSYSGDPFKECTKIPVESVRLAESQDQDRVAVEQEFSPPFAPPVPTAIEEAFKTVLLLSKSTTPQPTKAPAAFSVPTPGVLQPLISPYKYCGQVLKCGTNAHCVYNVTTATSVCECEDGFSGDPNRICYLKLVKPDELVKDLPVPDDFIEIGNIFDNNNSKTSSLILSGTGSGSSIYRIKNKHQNSGPVKNFCVRDSDCPRDKSCIADTCMNPCTLASMCGENQDCEVRDHKASCQCREGFPVKIYNNCYPQENSYNNGNNSTTTLSPLILCEPSPCGENSECSVTKVAPYVSCKCKPSMVGRPPNCRSTCIVNYECPDKLACVNGTCQDPCNGLCGYLARCRVYQHQAKCFCPQGFKLRKENGVIKCTPPMFPDSNGRFNNNHELVYSYVTSDSSSSEIASDSVTTDASLSFSDDTTTIDSISSEPDSVSDSLPYLEPLHSNEETVGDANTHIKIETDIVKETTISGASGTTFNLKENLDKIGNQNPEKNNEFNAKLGIAFDGNIGSHEHYFKKNDELKGQRIFDNPLFPMPTVPTFIKKNKNKVENVKGKVPSKEVNLMSRTQEEDFDDSNEFDF